MLSEQIQEFINEIRVLKEVGCLTVPKKSLPQLLTLLSQANLLVSDKPLPGKLTYRTIKLRESLTSITKPTLLIVTEEDYSADEKWRESVRQTAAYFLNVV